MESEGRIFRVPDRAGNKCRKGRESPFCGGGNSRSNSFWMQKQDRTFLQQPEKVYELSIL